MRFTYLGRCSLSIAVHASKSVLLHIAVRFYFSVLSDLAAHSIGIGTLESCGSLYLSRCSGIVAVHLRPSRCFLLVRFTAHTRCSHEVRFTLLATALLRGDGSLPLYGAFADQDGSLANHGALRLTRFTLIERCSRSIMVHSR